MRWPPSRPEVSSNVLALGAEAKGAGHRLEHVPDIGSTSQTLVDRARRGEPGPVWLVADEQNKGRGRLSRAWDSPTGNLYASLLLSDPAPAARVADLSFVLSLALRDAVLSAAGLADDHALTLKWPNDLMHGGRKAAGLLLEGGRGGEVAFVVAGFGVNVVAHPEGTTHASTDLTSAGYRVTRDATFLALSNAVASHLATWNRGEGFAEIRESWLRHAYGRGKTLRVNTLQESFEAVFKNIDESGRLVVETPGGERMVSAGDVFVLSGDEGTA